MNPVKLISLDIGEKRIGVAAADTSTKIAFALTTIEVDGTELDQIARIVREQAATTLVVGFPRNQQGEVTAQTSFVQDFVRRIDIADVKTVYQDESLTSVVAEQQLKSQKKPYSKADIDAYAAVIILTDYLEAHYA